MTSDTTAFVTALLLSLGVASLALAALAVWYSVHGARRRGAVLGLLGAVAMAVLVIVLWGTSTDVLWEELLLPLLVFSAAAGAGVALGAGLVYVLVAAR